VTCVYIFGMAVEARDYTGLYNVWLRRLWLKVLRGWRRVPKARHESKCHRASAEGIISLNLAIGSGRGL